jgi:hypothetical protein
VGGAGRAKPANICLGKPGRMLHVQVNARMINLWVVCVVGFDRPIPMVRGVNYLNPCRLQSCGTSTGPTKTIDRCNHKISDFDFELAFKWRDGVKKECFIDTFLGCAYTLDMFFRCVDYLSRCK